MHKHDKSYAADINATHEDVEVLDELLYSEMMAASEVFNPNDERYGKDYAANIANTVQDVEGDRGCEFNGRQVKAAWTAACNRVVEDHIENMNDADADYVETLRRWEAQRPAALRRAAIEAMAANVNG